MENIGQPVKQVNISIMRAFVRMREVMISHKEMARGIDVFRLHEHGLWATMQQD